MLMRAYERPHGLQWSIMKVGYLRADRKETRQKRRVWWRHEGVLHLSRTTPGPTPQCLSSLRILQVSWPTVLNPPKSAYCSHTHNVLASIPFDIGKGLSSGSCSGWLVRSSSRSEALTSTTVQRLLVVVPRFSVVPRITLLLLRLGSGGGEMVLSMSSLEYIILLTTLCVGSMSPSPWPSP